MGTGDDCQGKRQATSLIEADIKDIDNGMELDLDLSNLALQTQMVSWRGFVGHWLNVPHIWFIRHTIEFELRTTSMLISVPQRTHLLPIKFVSENKLNCQNGVGLVEDACCLFQPFYIIWQILDRPSGYKLNKDLTSVIQTEITLTCGVISTSKCVRLNRNTPTRLCRKARVDSLDSHFSILTVQRPILAAMKFCILKAANLRNQIAYLIKSASLKRLRRTGKIRFFTSCRRACWSSSKFKAWSKRYC